MRAAARSAKSAKSADSKRRRFWFSVPKSDPLVTYLESLPNPSKFIRDAVTAHTPGSLEDELRGLRQEVRLCRNEIETLKQALPQG